MTVNDFLIKYFSNKSQKIDTEQLKEQDEKFRDLYNESGGKIGGIYFVLLWLRMVNDRDEFNENKKKEPSKYPKGLQSECGKFNLDYHEHIGHSEKDVKYDFENITRLLIDKKEDNDRKGKLNSSYEPSGFRKRDGGESIQKEIQKKKYNYLANVEDVTKTAINFLDKDYQSFTEKFMKYLIDKKEKEEDMGSTQSELTKTIEQLIKDGATQIILTGAPGTGKTRLAKEVAKKLTEDNKKHLKENDSNSDDQKKDDSNSDYQLVQFHPSYDYTDFVEGLRPVEDANGKVEFRKLDGIFKKFCRKVAEINKSDEEHENQNKYFFIVDEINRADLSKVFGELMFCLESDKRGPQNSVQTQYANLRTYDPEDGSYYSEEKKDVFKDGFYIPENVIVIGTMNDIDRSVESMDFALRRRFIWKEINVESEEKIAEIIRKMLLSEMKRKQGEGSANSKSDMNIEEICSEVAEYICYVNKRIKEQPGLNQHYYISQGQFANVPGIEKCDSAEELIQKVWNLRLESLLYEYVRGEGNEEEFVNACAPCAWRTNQCPKENSDNKEDNALPEEQK